MMEFIVSLLKIDSSKFGDHNSVKINCSHIVDDFYFMEGDVESLERDEIEVVVIEYPLFVETLHSDEITREEMMDIAGIEINSDGVAELVGFRFE